MRVVTFNLQGARDVARIAAAIRGNEALRAADVFLLQEVRAYPAEGQSRAARLAAALDLAFAHRPSRPVRGDGTDGLAVLSRFAIRDVAVLPLRRFPWPVDEPRLALIVTLDAPARPLRVYNVHLSTTINLEERIDQLRPAVEAAAADRAGDVILAGDFNTNFLRWWRHRVPVGRSDQAGSLDDFMRERGFEAPVARCGPTVRVPPLPLRLDGFYTRGLTAGGFRVERGVRVSDHLPVWLDVSS